MLRNFRENIELLNLKKQIFDLRKRIREDTIFLKYKEKQLLIKNLNNKMRGEKC